MASNKFIVKLTQIMRQYPHIMNWSTDGLEIDILDIQKFQTEIHPIYFSSNYRSFLRQLNMYNFKKMSKKKNSISFRHEDFKRDNAASFAKIKRKLYKCQSKKKGIQSQNIELGEPPSTLVTPILDNDIQETLTLIKKEVTPAGLQLVAKLEQLLEKTISSSILSESKLTDNPISKQQLKDAPSFTKIQAQPEQKKPSYVSANSEFNFDSNIFQEPVYYGE